jgi:YidC/Oxa1 family membrane protein insertase
MDKNTVIGFILIGLVLIFFTWLNQPTPEQIEAQRKQDSLARVEAVRLLAEQQLREAKQSPVEETDSAVRAERANVLGVFAPATEGAEESVTLENDLLEVRISNKGGYVTHVRLKDYVTHDSLPLILFDGEESKLDFTLVTATNRVINTAELYFTPVKSADPNTAVMRLYAGGDSCYLDFTYTLKPDDYMLQYSIRAHNLNGVLSPNANAIDLAWEQNIRQLEKGRKYENQYSGLFYKFLADDVENLSQTHDASKKISNRLKWIAYKNKFFSTVLISEDGFESATLDSKELTNAYLKHFSTVTTLPFDPSGKEPARLRYYFGPNKYSLLKAFDDNVSESERLDLAKLVPMGISLFRAINKYFIIPIFDFLCNYIGSVGLVIFLLTLIVKTLLFPLTYKSYMSSAKMRVLRPQVEEINAKYPGQDKALERQKATMDLYKRAGASPMSGCLPMLLQMPVLFALYMFFPTSIELRQQSFLWAHDLSAYDAVISWDVNIPLVTPYFGNHISLFCLLMAVTNVIYSKYNMDMSNTGQQQMPGMKLMTYLMPVMLLVFLNQFAAGLNYYYFISTLISIGQTTIFRFFVNEDKLLAKLEENKKKPAKKSGLMKRLEDMQRQQQAVLRNQQGQKKRR